MRRAGQRRRGLRRRPARHRRAAALVDAVVARFGRLDALVNNASSFYATKVGAVDTAAWDDLIGSNLKAPLFLAQAAAPHLEPAAAAS
jgi:pteridine reductase